MYLSSCLLLKKDARVLQKKGAQVEEIDNFLFKINVNDVEYQVKFPISYPHEQPKVELIWEMRKIPVPCLGQELKEVVESLESLDISSFIVTEPEPIKLEVVKPKTVQKIKIKPIPYMEYYHDWKSLATTTASIGGRIKHPNEEEGKFLQRSMVPSIPQSGALVLKTRSGTVIKSTTMGKYDHLHVKSGVKSIHESEVRLQNKFGT